MEFPNTSPDNARDSHFQKARRRSDAEQESTRQEVQSLADWWHHLLTVGGHRVAKLCRHFSISVPWHEESYVAEPYIVVNDGLTRGASQEQVQALLRAHDADLIAYGPENHLYVGPRLRKRRSRVHQNPIVLDYPVYRIVRTGALYPGRAFGHLTLERASDVRLTAKSLKRYMSRLRRKLDAAGVCTQLITTVNVDLGLSTTCRGYRFNADWRYCVIDINPDFNNGTV